MEALKTAVSLFAVGTGSIEPVMHEPACGHARDGRLPARREEDRAEMLAVAELMEVSVRRGDVFVLRLPKGVGHEQYGRRLGVVVQSDSFLPRSMVLVAPPPPRPRRPRSGPEIDIDDTSTRVLVEQVGAVDIGRLGELAGHLSPEEQRGVDAALLTVLGLD